MGYPVEFIIGTMIMATAFITLAGILLALGFDRKIFGKKARSALLFSTVMGIAAIAFSWTWFSNPSDVTKLLAILSVSIQFVLLYPPIVSMAEVIGKD